MARAILDQGLENKDFLKARVAKLDAFQKALEPYTVDKCSETSGVSAAAIARKAHISKAQMSNLMTGTSWRPSVDTLEGLAYALMGIGHFLALRWIIWPAEQDTEPASAEAQSGGIPPAVLDTVMGFIAHGLGAT